MLCHHSYRSILLRMILTTLIFGYGSVGYAAALGGVDIESALNVLEKTYSYFLNAGLRASEKFNKEIDVQPLAKEALEWAPLIPYGSWKLPSIYQVVANNTHSSENEQDNINLLVLVSEPFTAPNESPPIHKFVSIVNPSLTSWEYLSGEHNILFDRKIGSEPQLVSNSLPAILSNGRIDMNDFTKERYGVIDMSGFATELSRDRQKTTYPDELRPAVQEYRILELPDTPFSAVIYQHSTYHDHIVAADLYGNQLKIALDLPAAMNPMLTLNLNQKSEEYPTVDVYRQPYWKNSAMLLFEKFIQANTFNSILDRIGSSEDSVVCDLNLPNYGVREHTITVKQETDEHSHVNISPRHPTSDFHPMNFSYQMRRGRNGNLHPLQMQLFPKQSHLIKF